MSKEELRHCPRCGGTAKIRYQMPFTWVECKKCKLSSERIPDYGYDQRDSESRAMAIDDWNTMEYIREKDVEYNDN